MVLLFFDLGTGEIFLIVLAIFLVFGPGKIPELAHSLGKFINEIKRASEDVKTEINREASRIKREKKREEYEKHKNETSGENPSGEDAETKKEENIRMKPGTGRKKKSSTVKKNQEKTSAAKQKPAAKKTGTSKTKVKKAKTTTKAKKEQTTKPKTTAQKTTRRKKAEKEAVGQKEESVRNEIKIKPAENTVSTKR